MRFVVLASGSKGNAIVVQGGGTTLLIDCGLSAKALRGRLYEAGLDFPNLTALLLTHGHGDHVKGAGRVAGGMRLRTYATPETVRFLARGGGLMHHVPIERDARFQVGALHVQAFPTLHDAPGSVGYVVEHEGARIGFCTDLGAASPPVEAALQNCDTLYLEFNHDLEMLRNGPYPPALVRRVSSDLGHLSNDQAAELLARLYSPRLHRVLLAHLSETNNTASLALDAAHRALGDIRGVDISIAPQHETSRWFEVQAGGKVVSESAAGDKAGAPSSVVFTANESIDNAATAGHRGRGGRTNAAPPLRHASVASADEMPAARTDAVRARRRENAKTGLRSKAGPSDSPAKNSIAVVRQLQLFGGSSE